MSRKNGKEEKNSGSGLASTLAIAGAAAAVGYLANELWTSWSQFQSEQQGTSSGPRAQPRRESWGTPRRGSWDQKVDEMKAKKKDRVPDKNTPDAVKCIVCVDNPREVINIPCGHVCLCLDCLGKINQLCPVCQQKITDSKLAYIS